MLLLRQKIKTALVHHQQRPLGTAPVQDLLHQRKGSQLSGGVVGLAEKDHVRGIIYGGNKTLRHRKILSLPQKMTLHRAAYGFQRCGILRKGGGRQQGAAGFCRQRKAEDQVRSAVAAEDLFCRQLLGIRKLCPQRPAQRVRVAVRSGDRLNDCPGNAIGQSQRADVGRKVQRILPVLLPVPCPVAAMDQCLHQSTPLTITPSKRARRLAAYIIRSARRMSSGSMGRTGSPMVGLG